MDLIFSLSETLDLVSPVVANHHKAVAYISNCLGKELGVSYSDLIELEIAGSMHDIGGLTLFERLNPTEFEYDNSDFHPEKGYLLLNKFKPLLKIAKIIRYHHQSWLGGKCVGISNEKIPFGSHILNLADRTSVLVKPEDKNILNSSNIIVKKIAEKKGDIFHPIIVDAFMELSKKDSFWLGLQYLDRPTYLSRNDKNDLIIPSDNDFEDFIKLIGSLIDYKSPFTVSHSASVAACSEIIAQYAGFEEDDIKNIRYAGYLHDLGKLAIPSEILEKNESLSKSEFNIVRTHAYHTNRVLAKVNGFDTIRIWGSLHHEKLNGTGYPFGLKGDEIPLGARIVAVADIFSALREKRPYRNSMTKLETINTLIAMANSYEIDKSLVEIVKLKFDELDVVREKANQSTQCDYKDFSKNINCFSSYSA